MIDNPKKYDLWLITVLILDFNVRVLNKLKLILKNYFAKKFIEV